VCKQLDEGDAVVTAENNRQYKKSELTYWILKYFNFGTLFLFFYEFSAVGAELFEF